jgi:hypothetical protein
LVFSNGNVRSGAISAEQLIGFVDSKK